MSEPDIAVFIAARFVETENGNREIHEARICGGCSDGWEAGFDPDRCDCGYSARVLREVAALRALVAFAGTDGDVSVERGDISVEEYATDKVWRDFILRYIAAIWRDHPDYDERWKP